mgnify:CR=1 FL=1
MDEEEDLSLNENENEQPEGALSSGEHFYEQDEVNPEIGRAHV